MTIRHFRIQYNERLDQWRVQWIPGWFPRWWPFWVTPRTPAEDGSRPELHFDNGREVEQYITEQILRDSHNPRWRPAIRMNSGAWLRGPKWREATAAAPTFIQRLQSLFERNHHGSDPAEE